MGKQRAIAKISTPRLFGVVARERLFAQLDANRGRPLLWVDGPPGAGKTTLVASYLGARCIPTLWYQVESNDSDPANLFHYLTLAAQAFPGADTPALPRLVPEHLSDLAAFARTFFRQLFARLPSDVVIVLDNYQEAPVDASLHEIVRSAASEVPPGSSICCISRIEAPASFTQLSASGRLFGVHWDMLQLTLDEVREISAARSIRDDGLVRALHQQSEGWVAGVTLMLERAGHVAPDAGTLNTETRESVFNYFASLLFDRAPEPTRHTLLCVSFLPHVTESMARKLSGRGDAGQVLEQLYRRHLFTDRRPGEEPIYQFHALFRDFLQTHARQTLDAAELQTLKLHCAQALKVSGDLEAAMDLWIEAERWEEAVHAILDAAKDLLGSGRRQTLVRWLRCIPAKLRVSEPWLAYWSGRAQLEIGPEEGVRTLETALALFRSSQNKQGKVECLTALLGGAFLGFHALETMDRWLDELLSELDYSPERSSPDVDLKVWGVLCVTLFHLRPWHPLTIPAYRRVDALLPHCTDPNVALVAAMHALVVAGLCGDFECGDRIATASKPLATRDTASPSEAAWWFAQMGWLRFIEARYDEALENLNRGRQIAEANGLRLVLRQIILWRLAVEWRSLGWSAASVSLLEVEAMPSPTSPMVEATLSLQKARRAGHRGQKHDAAKFALLSYEAAMRTQSRLEEVVFCLTNSDVLLHVGQNEHAEMLLTQVQELIGRAPVYQCFHAALVLMEARCAMVRGDSDSARTKLREALTLAREGSGRYYLRFSDWAMPPLFMLALEEGIEVDLLQQIIRMFRLRPQPDASEVWPWPVRIRTLGRFEVLVNDEPLEFSRKVPKKTLALLKSLIAYGGQEVPEQSLCDALWGDEEADAAKQALGITVVRLRKLLGVSDVVLQQGGKISLDRSLCWVDAWRFEERIAQSTDPGAVAKGLSLYGGKFLPEDEGEAWSVPTRERLRGKFIHLLATHGRALEETGDADGAIRLYLRGIDADPIVEAFHQGLMRCYQQLGRHTEAISVYRRLRQTLSVVLGVAPSVESQALYRTVMEACAERPDATEEGSVIPLAVGSINRQNGRSVRKAG
ncbi:MAG TPA: BTAD domain-containing putative transcriptional regulator [Burkholderiales bacterium]|nr:BTAD domain-containing putative transcriptional regulator [Burkholderiales bacterium]